MNSRSISRRTDSGMALLIVLAVIVLLTVLIVGFLSRASTERMASATYYESNRNLLFTDTVVNIVRSQIDHASTEEENGRPVAWASQPGMVRTFNADGSLLRAYKLYSDNQMVTETVDLAAATNALNQWWQSPAHYVDLNAPVMGRDESNGKKLVYPILDNAVIGNYTREDNGFEVTGAPVDTGDTDSSLGVRQQIPMPVRWLYILEDGTTVAPSGSGKTATIPGASRANPIVGRVAFWTDDETAKININTASSGTFWDIPRVSSFEDRDRMARFQPARREYQRYPGHPATVSLRPAFSPSLFSTDEQFEKFVFDFVPRIEAGGSQGGTVTSAAPIVLDNDRLYSSVDDALFSPERDQQLAPAELEKARFFLTARSNSPEVNLFNLPRMAIWPINAGTKTPSSLDRLIAFCATINSQPYYFQRSNPSSSTSDLGAFNGRNQELWSYISHLMTQPIPGFGNDSFADKYSSAETRQITTEIFDYIRSSNLYSTALGATAYTGDVNVAPAALSAPMKPGTRVGQVNPLTVGDTKGFGRIPTISRAVLQFYISGARTVPTAPGQPVRVWVPTDTRAVPEYNFTGTEPVPYSSWRGFLASAGVGTKVELMTSAILYFDTFDPNLGYSVPRYNFEVETEFGGPWTVQGTNQFGQPLVDESGDSLGRGPQQLGFTNSTLKINLDHNMLYNSKSNSLSWTFFPRVLGGPLGPLWMMQNYGYVAGNPSFSVGGVHNGINYGLIINSKGSGYPLASARVPVHIPITLVDSGGAPNLPENADLITKPLEWTPSLLFSGGSVTVRIKAGGAAGSGGEVVQTFQFDFPGFVKPSPAYADSQTRSPRTGLNLDRNKQFPVSADFRYRWLWASHQHGFFASPSISLYNTPDLRLVQDGDVAVSLVPTHGDKRLLAAKRALTTGVDFRPHEIYSDGNVRAAVDFRTDILNRHGAFGMNPGSGLMRSGRILNITYGANALPDMPGHLSNGVRSAVVGVDFPPDFDNGPFYMPDDTYINRADEGSVKDKLSGLGSGSTGGTGGRDVAWYYDYVLTDFTDTHNRDEYFSPARQMPSAAMFGSLPTGVARNKPWQTLLFRPDPGNHPGAVNPPDYALLDFFWMPVVEPYAISEPFSSNGKVNMNFQIMPFTYIYRGTGLYGVLKSEEMLAIPNATAGKGASNGQGVQVDDEYKVYSPDANNIFSSINYRKKLNIPETLRGFEERFNAGNIFLSETQVCSLPMIPEGQTWRANFENWWQDYQLTGDNSRERIYADILPKLTTRSNTYTVHFWAQSLKKSNAQTDEEAALWDNEKDKVTAEYRGSRTIERYIDPNDTSIPNYAGTLNASPSLGNFYRWRVLSNKAFLP